MFIASPVFDVEPKSIEIRNGSKTITVLQCLAFGQPPIQYNWEKFYPLSNRWKDPSSRAVSVTSSNLIFSVITEEDEGTYQCIVTNDDGSVVSNNATVTVYGE